MNINLAAVTDSLKILSRRYNVPVAVLRTFAKDKGLDVAYDSSRRTWFLNEDATTVRHFNETLANI